MEQVRLKITGETIFEKDTCILMFTAALLTIARTWKQTRCSSKGEWIKKLWYIYKWNIIQPQKE